MYVSDDAKRTKAKHPRARSGFQGNVRVLWRGDKATTFINHDAELGAIPKSVIWPDNITLEDLTSCHVSNACALRKQNRFRPHTKTTSSYRVDFAVIPGQTIHRAHALLPT